MATRPANETVDMKCVCVCVGPILAGHMEFQACTAMGLRAGSRYKFTTAPSLRGLRVNCTHVDRCEFITTNSYIMAGRPSMDNPRNSLSNKADRPARHFCCPTKPLIRAATSLVSVGESIGSILIPKHPLKNDVDPLERLLSQADMMFGWHCIIYTMPVMRAFCVPPLSPAHLLADSVANVCLCFYRLNKLDNIESICDAKHPTKTLRLLDFEAAKPVLHTIS